MSVRNARTLVAHWCPIFSYIGVPNKGNVANARNISKTMVLNTACGPQVAVVQLTCKKAPYKPIGRES